MKIFLLKNNLISINNWALYILVKQTSEGNTSLHIHFSLIKVLIWTKKTFVCLLIYLYHYKIRLCLLRDVLQWCAQLLLRCRQIVFLFSVTFVGGIDLSFYPIKKCAGQITSRSFELLDIADNEQELRIASISIIKVIIYS